MARTLEPEERDRRIKMVGDYFMENPNVSFREMSLYFKEHYNMDISIATISAYIQKYMLIRPTNKEKIQRILDARKPKTIEDEAVIQRINREVDLLRKGLTLDAIVELTGIDYWVLYRDVKTRLPRINPEVYEEIKDVLQEHSLSNLNNSPLKK